MAKAQNKRSTAARKAKSSPGVIRLTEKEWDDLLESPQANDAIAFAGVGPNGKPYPWACRTPAEVAEVVDGDPVVAVLIRVIRMGGEPLAARLK